MSTRMTRGIEPGTGTSRAHSNGTPEKPMLRAATAGNSASRSSVSVKMQLTTSLGCRSLRLRISRSSHSVAPRIAWASLRSTDEAPRRAKSRITEATLAGQGRFAAPGAPQGLDLGRLQAPVGALGEVVETQRTEAHALQRADAVADGLAHPLDLVVAALVDRQLEHAGLELADPGRRRAAVLEVDTLAQRPQRALAHRRRAHRHAVGPRDLEG